MQIWSKYTTPCHSRTPTPTHMHSHIHTHALKNTDSYHACEQAKKKVLHSIVLHSIVNCQLCCVQLSIRLHSIVNCAAFNCQLSIVNCAAFNCQLGCSQLSIVLRLIVNCQLSIVNCAAFNCQLGCIYLFACSELQRKSAAFNAAELNASHCHCRTNPHTYMHTHTCTQRHRRLRCTWAAKRRWLECALSLQPHSHTHIRAHKETAGYRAREQARRRWLECAAARQHSQWDLRAPSRKEVDLKSMLLAERWREELRAATRPRASAQTSSYYTTALCPTPAHTRRHAKELHTRWLHVDWYLYTVIIFVKYLYTVIIQGGEDS